MKKPDYITNTLWKELDKNQQSTFVQSYETFLNELNELSRIHNEIKAHNLAYLVAREMVQKGE